MALSWDLPPPPPSSTALKYIKYSSPAPHCLGPPSLLPLTFALFSQQLLGPVRQRFSLDRLGENCKCSMRSTKKAAVVVVRDPMIDSCGVWPKSASPRLLSRHPLVDSKASGAPGPVECAGTSRHPHCSIWVPSASLQLLCCESLL